MRSGGPSICLHLPEHCVIDFDRQIVKELVTGLDDVLESTEGSKVILHMLSPKKKGYFTEEEVEFLEEKLKRGESTTKKDASVRQTELLAKILPDLLVKSKQDVSKIVRNKHKSKVHSVSFLLAVLCAYENVVRFCTKQL